MKANELMIDDWVRIKSDIEPDDAYWLHDMQPGQALKVTEILSYGINPDWYCGEINDCVPENAIESIPLTTKILENNTSESNKNVFGGMNYALNADFFIENRGDRFCLSRRMAGHKYSTFWICDIQYVHELQHCLKLVGIEKQIEP